MSVAAKRLAPSATACLLALLLADAASARKYQMSGTWVMRTGEVFLPLQLDQGGAIDGRDPLVVSMGNLSGAVGFPNGAMLGAGRVTATGGAPAMLRVPAHRFVEDVRAVLPLDGVTLVQISTNWGIDAPYAAASLAPGAGPGSFTWCPQDPACAAGGGMRSTDPPQGGGTRNGRVIYRAGTNQFGGAMQLGLRRGGVNSFVFSQEPLRVGHNRFGWSGSTPRPVAVGSLGSADVPATDMWFARRAFVTQPTMAPPPGSPVLYPGPKLTTRLGLSSTGPGAVFYLPQIATGTMGTIAGQFTTIYGFGATTGTVFVQLDTGFTHTFFTIMGSDDRTRFGVGNLSLAAGGLSYRHSPAGTTPYGLFQKVSLSIAAPSPVLSTMGVATAVLLALLAAGYALRRRFA